MLTTFAVRNGLSETGDASIGGLRSAPMTVQSCDPATRTLWFLCREDSGTAQDLQQDPACQISFSDPHKNQYVSVAGRATLVHDSKKIAELWNFANEAWFPQGPTDPALRLIKVEVEAAEIWDGPSPMAALVLMFANSVVGMDPPVGLGAHRRVEEEGRRQTGLDSNRSTQHHA